MLGRKDGHSYGGTCFRQKHRCSVRNRRGRETDGEDRSWHLWDEVVEYSMDDAAESRIVSHVPHHVNSWELHVGLFHPDNLRPTLQPPPLPATPATSDNPPS